MPCSARRLKPLVPGEGFSVGLPSAQASAGLPSASASSRRIASGREGRGSGCAAIQASTCSTVSNDRRKATVGGLTEPFGRPLGFFCTNNP